MGGKAIKIAQRIERKNFFKYTKDIIPRVESAFNTKVKMVKGFHDKKDFGDLDLLVLADRDFGNRRKIIESEFNPKEININSHLISFSYKGDDEYLQVDLIFTPEHNWETSKVFFDWGDLGNLIGKTLNNYGRLNNHGYSLKFGFDGIKCKLKYKSGSKNIILSKDNTSIFGFMGIDYNQWKRGFNNREEMFDYIINSKYYDYDSFQWENLSSINKQRNKKRPNYQEFLNYIDSNNYKKTIKWKSVDYHLDYIKNYFGVDIKKEMESFQKEIDNTKIIKDKFNGKLVMSVFPELQGIELGNNMRKFKELHNDWRSYALSSNNIIEDFKKWYIGNK